jgi:squalene-hopene/tetraprenyl-beta-curcumene cyclase
MTRVVSLLCLAVVPGVCEDWNPRLAAEYLDARQKEWFAWKPANGTGGPCVSCHTGVTYLLARPSLRRVLGEKEPTSYETGLTAGLLARVRDKDAKGVFRSFTGEPLASQAFGVESIVAALFLTSDTALDRMWSSQIREGEAKGAWPWFSLNLDPWEMQDSQFYGATLAAMAAGSAPVSYRSRPDIKERIADLASYLSRAQTSQPLHNRLMLLWAATSLPEALPARTRKAIVDEVWQKQQPDGGWTLDALGPWKAHEAAPAASGTNSYATGLTTVALIKAGTAASDVRLVRALAWLRSHQDPQSGSWAAESMNKVFPTESMMAKFMRDAATAYSAIALAESGR